MQSRKKRLAIHITLGMFAIPFVVAVAIFASLFSLTHHWLMPQAPMLFDAADRERRIGVWTNEDDADFSRCLDVVLISDDASTPSPANLEEVQDLSFGSHGAVMHGVGQALVPKGSTLRILHAPIADCHHTVLVREVAQFHFPFVLPMRLVVLLAALTLGGAVLGGELAVWLARRLRPSIARG